MGKNCRFWSWGTNPHPRTPIPSLGTPTLIQDPYPKPWDQNLQPRTPIHIPGILTLSPESPACNSGTPNPHPPVPVPHHPTSPYPVLWDSAPPDPTGSRGRTGPHPAHPKPALFPLLLPWIYPPTPNPGLALISWEKSLRNTPNPVPVGCVTVLNDSSFPLGCHGPKIKPCFPSPINRCLYSELGWNLKLKKKKPNKK